VRLEQVHAKADAHKDAEEEGGHHKEREHSVKGLAGAIPDTNNVKDVKRKGNNPHPVPPGRPAEEAVCNHTRPTKADKNALINLCIVLDDMLYRILG